MEIPRIVIRLAGPQSTAGIAPSRVLDLDHLGAEPGKRLGAGRPRLELRKIDDAHAFETVEFYANFIHCSSLLPVSAADRPRPNYSAQFGLRNKLLLDK